MKKRFTLCLVLALCLTVVLPILPVSAAESGTCGENLTWTLEDGTLTISGSGPMDCWETYDAPWFDYRNEIERLVVEEGVTSIGSNAIYHCNNLVEIQLPDSLETIHRDAFCSADGITKIVIPANVTTIEQYVFQYCRSLSLIVFTGDAPAFGESTFYQMDATLVYPGDNATWTDEVRQSYGGTVDWVASDVHSDGGTYGDHDTTWAFDNGKLTITAEQYMSRWTKDENAPWYAYRGLIEEAVVTGTMTSIAAETFMHCSNLKKVTIPDQILVISDCVFSGCVLLEEIDLPDTVLTIGEQAFYGCRSLKEIVLPKELDRIGENAFEGCDSLKSVSIPKKVTSVGNYAFASCAALEEIWFSGEMPYFGTNPFEKNKITVYYPSGDKTWSDSSINKLKKSDGTTEIVFEEYDTGGPSNACGDNLTWEFADGVLTISGTGDMYSPNDFTLWADHREEVKKIVIESGVTSISHNAFEGFTSLTEVSIPKTVTTINGRAFLNCTALKMFTVPNGVTKIGDFCFTGCTALEEVHIAATVTYIEMDAFDNCTALKEIYFYGDAVKMYDTFMNVVATAYYPAGNDTWTEAVLKDYGGTITWVAKNCMTGHTEVADKGKAATCTEDGLTDGKHCSVCGETVTAQEVIPATGHTEVTGEGKEATCTEDGLTGEKTCSVCGQVLGAQEVIPATGHTEVTGEGTEATCTEDGLTGEKTCSVCGQVLGAQEVIPATGHTEVTGEGKEATCTEDGLMGEKTCSVCGEIIAAQEVIPAIGHSFGDWVVTKEPTADAEGSEERTCTACGVAEQRTVGKVPPTEQTQAPTAGPEPLGTTGGDNQEEKDPAGGWIILAVVCVIAAGAVGAVVFFKRKK